MLYELFAVINGNVFKKQYKTEKGAFKALDALSNNKSLNISWITLRSVNDEMFVQLNLEKGEKLCI